MICLEVGKQVSGPCMFYCAMHAAEGDGWLDHELHGGGPCLACNRHSTSLDMFRIWMLTNTHLIVLFIGLDIVSDLAATSREAARSLMAVVWSVTRKRVTNLARLVGITEACSLFCF